MTKIIGLTGGIGSGKTIVAKYIEALGIPVYISDDEARKIMETDEVLDLIRNEFGEEVIDNHKLNRDKLAQLVFTNSEKLDKLNKIVHPLVKKHFDLWVEMNQNAQFIIKEAAILFESGSYKDCDTIITVTAPLETRIQRVMQRDKCDRSAVLKRIESQWTDEQRIVKSDYVIHNISVDTTYKQIEQILNLLKNK
jgi:dephospho-CoA kinase